MINCRETSALISEGMDKPLSFGKRAAIGLHLFICPACRNFKTHSLFIRKAAHQYTDYLQAQLGKKS